MAESGRHLYPLLFSPILKDYIWGGRNLAKVLGRELPEGRVAESWEIAAHEDGTSNVTNGAYAGMSLTEIHSILGLDLVGRNNNWAQERGKFPLLVKLLDANDRLSVQVHPTDAYALSHEGNELGKTEMWVVLHAEPGAELIVGTRRGITPDIFRDSIESGTVEKCLHSVPVNAGDVVCVPSGTVHAILEGVVIAEIQQNSNTTYRVFDWNRTNNGKQRPLHIDKAMEVINFEYVEPGLNQPKLINKDEGIQSYLLCRNQYFSTERVVMSARSTFSGELDGETLEIWGALQGTIEINGVELSSIEFALLPAALGSYRIRSTGEAVCLRTYVERF